MRKRLNCRKIPAQFPIGEDATSLIFLHASARPATTRPGWALLWDQDDTADLLGWYEVIYEDGFATTIPLRYGVNIEEWNWASRRSEWDYCYGADAVPLGGQRKIPLHSLHSNGRTRASGRESRKSA